MTKTGNKQNYIYDTIVIGAGVSGLSAAYQLKKKNFHILLLEQEKRAGGKIETNRDPNFISEYGPDTFLQENSHLMKLIDELNLTSELLYSMPNAIKRFIYLNKKLVYLPIGFKQFILSSFLSPIAKPRLAWEPFIPCKNKETKETVTAFFMRRMGKQSMRNLFDHFVSGIYASNVYKLGAKENFSVFYEIENRHSSIFSFMQRAIKKMTKRKKAGYKPKNGMHSFAEGLETLVEGLTARLHNELVLDTQIVKINQKENKIWEIHSQQKTYQTKTILWAAPAYVTAQFLESFAKPSADILNSINYPPLATGTIYFRSEHVPHSMDGFGFLIPRTEKISLLGSIWHGSLFPDHVAPGYKAFRFYIGEDTSSELALKTEKEILEIVINDLKKCMNINPDHQPAFYQYHLEEKAIPLYYPGHQEKITQIINGIKPFSGLFLTGNYLHGVSLNDCIKQSNRSAYHVKQYLFQNPETK